MPADSLGLPWLVNFAVARACFTHRLAPNCRNHTGATTPDLRFSFGYLPNSCPLGRARTHLACVGQCQPLGHPTARSPALLPGASSGLPPSAAAAEAAIASCAKPGESRVSEREGPERTGNAGFNAVIIACDKLGDTFRFERIAPISTCQPDPPRPLTPAAVAGVDSDSSAWRRSLTPGRRALSDPGASGGRRSMHQTQRRCAFMASGNNKLAFSRKLSCQSVIR